MDKDKLSELLSEIDKKTFQEIMAKLFIDVNRYSMSIENITPKKKVKKAPTPEL